MIRKSSVEESAIMRETASRMFEWGREEGVNINKLSIKWRANAFGRPFVYLRAAEEIHKDEVLLNIPEKIVLSPKKVYRIPILCAIAEANPDVFASSDRFLNQCFLLILLVLFELNKGPDGRYSPYFDMVFLTNDLEFWTEENAAAIRDPYARRFMDTEMAKLERMYQKCKHVLHEHAHHLGPCDWQRFKRVALLVVSRYFLDEFDQLMLVPFFDLLNHSNENNVTFSQTEVRNRNLLGNFSLEVNNSDDAIEEYEEPERPAGPDRKTSSPFPPQNAFDEDAHSTNSGFGSNCTEDEEGEELDEICVLNNSSTQSFGNHVEDEDPEECSIKVYSTSRQPIKKNQELYISYGRRNNFFLLTFYGFVLPNNKYNHFRFHFNATAFRRDVNGGNNCNHPAWTCVTPTGVSSLFKFKHGKLSLEFMAKLRETLGLSRHRSIANEKFVVGAYFGFFDYFSRLFSSGRCKATNEFQLYAQQHDELNEEIVRNHKQMATRLLGLLDRFEKNSQFNVNLITSHLTNGKTPAERQEVQQTLRSLRKYLSTVIRPIIGCPA